MSKAQQTDSATRHLIRGSAWMIAARWAMRLIGLASTVILARLLAPDDFGVIAIALIASGLLETIAYAGVDLALMRPGADSREHYDTAWTIQLIQGALIAGFLLLLAPWVAPFFSEPRATAVMQVIALRPLIMGLQNIGIVAFRKELDFAKDFRFTLYTKLANFAIVVGAAVWLRDYWALVIGMTSSSLIAVAFSYSMHPYRPRLSMAKAGAIWGFSQWLIISRVGNFLSRKTDEFVIGRLLGTSAMGGYHVANELATMPTSELVMPLRRAMFPTMAKVSENREELQKLLLLSVSAVAAMCFSVGFGLMSVAPELIPVVLGDKWVSGIDPMRWLALYGAVSSLTLILETPLWVSGKTRLSAVLTWLEVALLWPTAYLATQATGIEGAAMARLGVSVVLLPLMLHCVAKACSIGVGRLYGAIWRPLAAGLVMSASLTLITPATVGSVVLTLVVKVLAGAIIFPGLLLLLWFATGRPLGVERSAVDAIAAVVARRRGD